MNETLHKMLKPTETIEMSMPKIIEAFVSFYGEEKREYIENKLKNLVIVGYLNPDKMRSIIYEIKNTKTEELIEYFFQKAGVNEGKERLKKILFSNSNFDHLRLQPIQKYVQYLETNKEAPYYESNKKDALIFLKTINPNVTLENMEELHKQGAFDDIINLIPIYKEIINIYLKELKKIEEYIEEEKNNQKLERDLTNKFWFQLLNEFSYLFPKSELDNVKSTFEKYNYIYSSNKMIDSYISIFLKGTPLIDAFSRESEELLLNGSDWKKESIIKDRIKFFNNMGINLGNDYQLYKNNDECNKLIPPQELIEKIKKRKNELYNSMLNQYYKSTKDYKINRTKIDSYNLLYKDDSFNANAYFNRMTFVTQNLLLENGKYKLFPLMCINMNLLEYLDISVIHELNHVFELELQNINNGDAQFSCGWDIVESKLDLKVEEEEKLGERTEKREYELFSEIINHIIAEEITTILHDRGDYIFNDKSNVKIKGATSYEETFFLVKDFYETYKKEILESRRSRDMRPLFDKVGKENFDALNKLFHVFYENFGGMKYYSLISDLKNNKETENVNLLRKICSDRDNILKAMQERATLNIQTQK